ncbi:MAG: sigma-70 family RNA polymerase sigma factor [Planctomycetaceae bacterium]|nr:sigma-70 family RNA polymerase sigma factor [Planctomycetaceae bacterium]
MFSTPRAARITDSERDAALRRLYATQPVDVHSDDARLVIESFYGLMRRLASRWHAIPVLRDDLMSAGQFGLLRCIMSYRAGAGSSFVGYAATCMNNAMLDVVRTHQRKNGRTVSRENLEVEGEVSTFEPHDPLAMHEEDLDRSEQCARLLSILEEHEREILCRYHGVGTPPQTFREIADETGLSVGQVTRVVSRSLETIRTRFRLALESA